MEAQTKQRDFLFDNYKALLIVLVVLGHFMEPSYKNNDFLYTLKWLIVSFHMPAFIFISGYFSKRQLSFSVLVRKLAVPYIVYEIVYYLLYTYILHKETGLYLLYPKFSLWYILALFVWRVITPYVRRIPHYMILTVAAGLCIGLSGMPDNYMSIPRILAFYPFFLAGMNFERSTVSRLRTSSYKIAAAAGVLAFIAFLSLEPLHKFYSPKIFYGRYNYEFLGQTPAEGILCRLVCYGIGFLMTYALMILISEKQTWYSYMGGRTMAVYLFHGLTYSYIKECTDLLQNVNTMIESAALVLFCAALAFLFSIPQLTTFTNAVSNIPAPVFPKARPKLVRPGRPYLS